ncbi:hypothetical protein FJZ36_14100 [Candidatus Poribacteria bacterium]|nr:hypothetical protein [Candidatus Poribacteria bacterium]
MPDGSAPLPPARLRALRCLAVAAIAALLWAGGTRTAHAAPRSRVYGATLFVLGVGARFAAAMTDAQSQSTYDDYLLTARQADIRRFHDDYRSKRRLSQGLSRSGAGMIAVGVLFTAYAALRPDESPPMTASADRDSVRLAWNHPF